MVAAFVRLLALAALVLMPIGMGREPAVAAAPAVSASGIHCGPQQPHGEQDKSGAAMHCSACTTLPGEFADRPAAIVPDGPARAGAPIHQLSGRELEIATPPPKRA